MPLPDPWVDPRIGRGARQIALGTVIGSWFSSLGAVLAHPHEYPAGFALGSLAVLALPLLWALPEFWRAANSLLALRVFVIVSLLSRLIDPLFAPPGQIDYSMLTHVQVAAALITGVVLSWRVGLPLVTLAVASLFAQRTAIVGLNQALAESAMFASSFMAMFVLAATVNREVTRLAETTAASLDSITGRAEPSAELDLFRALGRQLLELAQPGDRVTLRWIGKPGGAAATLTLVGTDLESRPQPALTTSPQVSVTADADALLIEIDALREVTSDPDA